jgi:hypothetical protein
MFDLHRFDMREEHNVLLITATVGDEIGSNYDIMLLADFMRGTTRGP